MADVVREACGLDKVRVGRLDFIGSWRRRTHRPVFVSQSFGDAAAELRDLQRVSETSVVQPVLVASDDLSLARQPAERARVEDAVAVAGKLAARVATAIPFGDSPRQRKGVVRQTRSLRGAGQRGLRCVSQASKLGLRLLLA